MEKLSKTFSSTEVSSYSKVFGEILENKEKFCNSFQKMMEKFCGNVRGKKICVTLLEKIEKIFENL